MAIRSSSDVLGPYGRLARDGRASHLQGVYVFSRRITFTSTGKAIELCSVPAYSMYLHAACEVITTFNGTTPTLKVGFFGSSIGTSDNDDALIDTNDIDLTSTGATFVTDKLGVIDRGAHILGATMAAAAAPTQGEALLTISFAPPSGESVLAF